MLLQCIKSKPKTAPNTARRLTLDTVSKKYGTFAAVKDVTFTLEAGEFLTLLGPSGSGKTTTLLMVAGFEVPTSGAIRVGDVDVVSRPPKERNFGVVFQSYALFPHMTVLENVSFPLKMRGHPRAKRRKQAMEMLAIVGLDAFADRRPRELSGGQQQRVALARALVFRPDALLLDEPLGALDKNLRERMQYEIKDLQRRMGISVLFVTHDQEEAMTMSDRIAVMNKGQIVQMGPPREVYDHPQTPFVASFLGETNLWPCQVACENGPHVRITMEGGLPAVATAPARPITGPALLSMRPERIRILREGERADTELEVVVNNQVFLGRHARIQVEIGGLTFAIVVSDPALAATANPGSLIRIGWMAGDAQVLRHDT